MPESQPIPIEQALRESEERWKFALEVAGAGVLDWNIVTGQMFFSDRWRAMAGYGPGDIDETVDALKSLVHPDDLPAALADLQRALDGQTASHKVEHRLRCADNRWIWVEARSLVTRRASDGTPLRMIGTHIDITARKNAEKERLDFETRVQQAQKLESLGVLAGGIAHDFNNLLTWILGYADLALPHVPETSPAHEFISEVINGGKRAAELTMQLLVYAGRAHTVPSSLNLSALVEEMVPLLQMSVSKKIALRWELAPDLPLVNADTAQIRQILMNLVINASEAVGDRCGTITVTCGVKQREGDSQVYLQVADSGCGMSESTRKKIFDPFFTTKFTGRGLGLSAVLGIVRAHSGSITCKSKLGEGTTFTVLFPLATSTAKKSEPVRTSSPAAGRRCTVLVVDDENSVRQVAQLMLERAGFTVLSATDGLDALRIFREHPGEIELTLLDMNMPQMDGEETFREIRKIRSDAKVILTSGYSELYTQDRVRQYQHMVTFLQKPYLQDQLMNAVRNMLDR
jgi:PAS domain S-box-containing protein